MPAEIMPCSKHGNVLGVNQPTKKRIIRECRHTTLEPGKGRLKTFLKRSRSIFVLFR